MLDGMIKGAVLYMVSLLIAVFIFVIYKLSFFFFSALLLSMAAGAAIGYYKEKKGKGDDVL